MVVKENKAEVAQQTVNCRKCYTIKYWVRTWKDRERFVSKQKDWVKAVILKHQKDGIVNLTRDLRISTQKTSLKKNNSKIINVVNIRISDFLISFKHFFYSKPTFKINKK